MHDYRLIIWGAKMKLLGSITRRAVIAAALSVGALAGTSVAAADKLKVAA